MNVDTCCAAKRFECPPTGTSREHRQDHEYRPHPPDVHGRLVRYCKHLVSRLAVRGSESDRRANHFDTKSVVEQVTKEWSRSVQSLRRAMVVLVEDI